MRKIILILFLFFFMSGLQAQKVVKIGILADTFIEESELMLKELQVEIRAVTGQESVIEFGDVLVNNFDGLDAKLNYEKLLKNDTDIILSFGIINTMMIYKEKNYPKPTIVFGSVNSDFVNIPKDQKTTIKNNITYIITPASYTNDLDVFSSIFTYKKVGILIDEFLIKALPVAKIFDSYFLNKDSGYRLIPVSKEMNIKTDFSDLDAIYLASVYSLNSKKIKGLVNQINEEKLPSFSAIGKKDVELGILATNQPASNISQFFRRIALNIEAVISGVNPSELPIFIDYKNKLSINYNTANKINFPVRYSMLAKADFVGGPIEPNPEITLSILDVMLGVLKMNLDLKVEKKNLNLSLQDVKSAKSSYLPDLTVDGGGVYIDPEIAVLSNGQNPEFSTSGSATLKQLIYSESASANSDIQNELMNAQKEVYNSAQLDALLNASIAYLNTLILKTNVSIQNKNLQITKLNLDLAQQNFESGASGKSDVLRFRSQLAQNTQNFIEAGNQVKQSFNTINELLNNPISKKIDVENVELAKGLFKNYKYEAFLELLDTPKKHKALIEFLIEEAINNAPELKNIGYNISAIQRSYDLNDTGRFLPIISLQGQYNLAFSKSGKGSQFPVGVPSLPDGNYNIGLNISLPIFQQNKKNINRQSAKIQKDQLKIQKESAVLTIEKNVNNIVLEIINQIANIEISKIAEIAAEESLDLTQNAYKNGAVPVIQLIDAQSNYLQSQLVFASANYNYLITALKLERTIGYYFLMNSEADNEAFIQRANNFILNKN